MRYTFDDIQIMTPEQPGGTCGKLAPVTIEWNASVADWPQVLGQGIAAIRVHSTVGGITQPRDILPTATIEAEFILALVAKALALRQHDQFWLEQMRLQWAVERRGAAQAAPQLRLVKS